jgi:hypothetical protein
MREMLRRLFSISVPVVGHGAMQILPGEPARMAAGRLWLKLLLTWLLFLAFLVPIGFGLQPWLAIALGAIALVLSAPVLFAVLDLATFYGLPGLRIEDRALLVKGEGGPVRRYPYAKVVAIRQVTTTVASGDLYQLEVGFADGTQWGTRRQGEAALPALTQFGDLISERSGRAVSPTFAA